MKKTNQAEAGANLSGCVDFDKFTAMRRKAPYPVLVSHLWGAETSSRTEVVDSAGFVPS